MVRHETPLLVVQQGPCQCKCRMGGSSGSPGRGAHVREDGAGEAQQLVCRVAGGRSHTWRERPGEALFLGSAQVGLWLSLEERN